MLTNDKAQPFAVVGLLNMPMGLALSCGWTAKFYRIGIFGQEVSSTSEVDDDSLH